MLGSMALRDKLSRGQHRLSPLAVLLAGLFVAACGGAARPTTQTAHGPTLPDSKVMAITKADLAISSSANASSYIVGHPDAVRQAQQLVKPLIVANTLQVNESDPTAGGLITSITDQLDNTAPGFTTGNGSNERLNAPLVHRLFVFGLKDPKQVFHPTAAQGVSQLEQLLHGIAADTQVNAAGASPVVTARELLTEDQRAASRYWPDLAKRLQTLASSLS